MVFQRPASLTAKPAIFPTLFRPFSHTSSLDADCLHISHHQHMVSTRPHVKIFLAQLCIAQHRHSHLIYSLSTALLCFDNLDISWDTRSSLVSTSSLLYRQLHTGEYTGLNVLRRALNSSAPRPCETLQALLFGSWRKEVLIITKHAQGPDL